MRAQRPQPGNALQEGRDASIESEGLGNSSGAELSVLLFSSSLLLLLRVLARETGILARGGCPAKISPRYARESSAFWPVELPSKNCRASRERVCESIVNVLVRAG